MSAFLSSNAYAIGYLDSGYGYSASLTEIRLRNKAGVYLNSKEADISATADVALAAKIIPTTGDGKPDPEADWSAVHMYDLDGDSSWPIINFSYFYVDKDVGVLGTTGTLLKAFLEFVLSASGQAMLESFGFTKLPLDIETYNTETVDNILVTSGQAWTEETASDTRTYEGAGPYVLSEKRRSYGEYQRSEFAADIADLQLAHDLMMKDHVALHALEKNYTALAADLLATKMSDARTEGRLELLEQVVAEHIADKDIHDKTQRQATAMAVVAIVLTAINLAVLLRVWKKQKKLGGTGYESKLPDIQLVDQA